MKNPYFCLCWSQQKIKTWVILRESLQLKAFLGRKVNFGSIESEILPPVYKSSIQTGIRCGLCNPSYRKSSKETRGSYSFSEGSNAGLIRILPKFGHFCLLIIMFAVGLIRMRVLFKGGSLLRIYSNQSWKSKKTV